LLRDPSVTQVVCAPGNAGIAEEVHTVQLDVKNAAEITSLAQELSVELVVIGPEVPLAHGAADAVTAAGIACFGPLRSAAMIEASKSFAKEIMINAGVPTAASHTCATIKEVAAAIDEFGAPYVIKDDGLAAGKGVVVTSSRDEALAHAQECLTKVDGKVVVEEFLDGPEVSLFLVSDGKHVVPLAPAQDFKRAYADDKGPNTGGMGAYSPLPWIDESLVAEVVETVGQPVVDYMNSIGNPFSGLLYAGLALTKRGVRVIEFNARFGDPETQVVLARLQTPLSDVLYAAATGSLNRLPALKWSDDAAVTVVIASENYPEAPVTGDRIEGLAEADAVDGVDVFHAGTAKVDGHIVTAGGRILSVTAVGVDLAQARARAYEAISKITFRGSHFRTDIAQKASV
jgi:phosphoribosylamine--glycine ligase